jgi:hypothetical protein
MGVPTSEIGYNSATTGRGVHEVRRGHPVALEKKRIGLCDRKTLCYLVKVMFILEQTTNAREGGVEV